LTFVKKGENVIKMKADWSEAELLMGELIGLKTKITKSTRRELIGITGTIVDETMHTFTIEKTNGKEIKVPKKSCVFQFGNKKDIDGKKLCFRPEDRIKKYWRKFHGKIKRMRG